MTHVLTLALKDMRLLLRDRMGAFWIFVFPLVYALFFGAMFGGGGKRGGMRVAVLDLDRTEASRAYRARLEKSDALRLSDADSLEQARAAVLKGDMTAYVVVEKGFADAQMQFFARPPLQIGIDPSRAAERGMLQGLLVEAAFKGMAEDFSDPQRMKARIGQAKKSVQDDDDLPAAQKAVFSLFMDSLDAFFKNIDPELYKKGPMSQSMAVPVTEIRANDQITSNSYEIAFPQAIVWALLGCSAGFAISLVKERTEGTLLRLRLAPLTRGQVLAGKAAACYLTCVMVIVVLLGVGIVLKVRVLDRPLHLAGAIASAGVCFVGLMMFMSTLGTTEQSVAGAGWGINTVMAMLGGGMVPLAFMPDWLGTISSISPIKWCILALEGAIWRGFSATDMLLPCGILVGVGLLAFVGGVWQFSRRDG